MTNHISRRAVLRGLGAALALPSLEVMSPATSLFGAEAAASLAPRRMAFIFVPNGIHMPDWTPQEVGYSYRLPYILEPLAGVKDDLLVISGLTHDKGRANGDGPGDHARCASVFLTGAQPRKTSGANIRSGISVDQAAAQAIGSATKFASLELGCEAGRGAGNCDSGYSCAYSSNVSWAASTTPVGKEVNPRLVFERLFSHGPASEVAANRGQREQFQKSILDFIAEDARRLHGRLGKTDQRKLDEYLNGIREIERRVEKTETRSGNLDELVAGYAIPAGVPKEYGEHIRLLGDMMVLAFQTDLTRISTFMFANAGSNRAYNQVEVPDGHHTLSHHGGDPKKHAKIRKINRFHVTQLAYLLEKLKSIPEADGTLLDNCMIVYGSGLSDGNRHNNENLPVLLAGGGGGSITTGRHIEYERETPMTNLFLSMLDRMGAPRSHLGDSTGLLNRLS